MLDAMHLKPFGADSVKKLATACDKIESCCVVWPRFQIYLKHICLKHKKVQIEIPISKL